MPRQAKIKAKEEYKKYKELHLGEVIKSEKDYIEVLENMEIKLLGRRDKNKYAL